MTKEFTALDLLDDRAVTSSKAADRCRDKAESIAEANHVDHKSYKMGEAIGYIEARKIMDAELRRLCNRLQNGCLSISDFGINL